MNPFKQTLLAATVATLALGGLVYAPVTQAAATAEELSNSSDQALKSLLANNPLAMDISKKAMGVLVFPNMVKAGLVFGGAYGEGVLNKDGASDTYFNSVSASWGLQAGAQSYGYAVFLMTDEALTYLERSEGWELGVGPSLVLVNEGAAKNISTSTLQEDAYAFIFDQQGLMASLSIEGTKVTRIKR